MSNRNIAFAKRQREMKQKERAKEKEQKKAERRAKAATPGGDKSGEEDPDIAGIVPGPQPTE